MAVPQTQPKVSFRLVAALTDIGAGAPAQLTNLPTGVFGFEGGADPYRIYDYQTFLYAQTNGLSPGGLYFVTEDQLGNKVAVLVTEASQIGTDTGAKLLYVVAETGTPMALTGTYATPTAAIAQAVIDRASAAVPVDILVMPGTYVGFALQENVHVKALTEGRSNQTAQRTTTISSTITFAAAGAACAASLGGLQISTGANTAIDGTNGTNYVVTLQNCRLVNNDAANPVIDPVAGEYALYGCQIDAQGGSSTIASSTAILTMSECQLTGPTSLGGIHDLTNTSFSGVVSSNNGSTTLNHCTIVANSAGGALQLSGTANSTLRSCTIDNATNTLTVGGAAGTLAIAGGTTGIRTVATGITVNVTQPLGAARRTQTLATTGSVNDDTDVIVVTLAAGVGTEVISLPDPDVQLPMKELTIKRADNVVRQCDIDPTVTTQIDNLGAGVAVQLAPGDYLNLMADRGNGRWLRV